MHDDFLCCRTQCGLAGRVCLPEYSSKYVVASLSPDVSCDRALWEAMENGPASSDPNNDHVVRFQPRQ